MTGNTTSVGFLGFGEAARAFCATLSQGDGPPKICAYDIELERAGAQEMRDAMSQQGVVVAGTHEELSRASLIFSAVTADQSLEAVTPLLPFLGQGNVIADINSVSPGRKQETARQVCATGASYADFAVMAPVHPRGHRTPCLLAGELPPHLVAWLDAMTFDWRVVARQPGGAAAIKMVRSLFVKGLEAITVETLLAAQASGCLDEIIGSLANSYPGLGWPDIADYQLERTVTHGLRRAAEMNECAATLNELGLTGELAAAIAKVQLMQGETAGKVSGRQSLEERVAANLARRRAE